MSLMAVLAMAFLTSCGSSKPKVTIPTGSLTTLVGDLPGPCDAVSFPFNITDLVFTGPSANGETSIATVPINASSVSEPEIRINLGCLRDFHDPALHGDGGLSERTTSLKSISVSLR